MQERLQSDYMLGAGVMRRPTRVQLERMMDLVHVLAQRASPDDRPIHTTWPQLAKAMGFPVAGMTVRAIKDRYGSRIERTMRYLIAAGWVEGWDVAYDGRETIGILVRLAPKGCRADVAQLARAPLSPHERPPAQGRPRRPRASRTQRSERRAAHTERRDFLGDKVAPPSGGVRGGPVAQASLILDPPRSDTAVRARGRAPGRREQAREDRAALLAALEAGEQLGTRERALLSEQVRAALAEWLATDGTEGGGAATVAALPWIAAVPVDLLAREAARVGVDLLNATAPRRLAGPPPRVAFSLAISERQQERLVIAARQIERYGLGADRSTVAALVLDLVSECLQAHDPQRSRRERRPGVSSEWLWELGFRSRPPMTLGGIAVALRRQARRWRAHHRSRTAPAGA